jgi:hypothetical protein
MHLNADCPECQHYGPHDQAPDGVAMFTCPLCDTTFETKEAFPD